jgi:membrane associated rhomboid family serine protease
MAEAPITFIILLLTGFVSWRAMENPELTRKLLHHPYSVKHQKQYYRLLSHLLVHSGFPHLLLNMFVFYSFGSAVENSLKYLYGPSQGALYFIGLYVLGGLAATIPSMLKQSDNYGYSAVGASGAVSAVMMTFMIMYPTAQLAFFFILPMPAFLGVFVFFLLEHFMQKRMRTNIAHDAHIWGAIFGVVFVLLLDPEFIQRFLMQVKDYFSNLLS